MIKITSIVKDNNVKIKINDITHLSFKYSDYIGHQTWIDNQLTRFKIEIYLKGKNVILVEYDNIKKFKSVIDCLDKIKP